MATACAPDWIPFGIRETKVETETRIIIELLDVLPDSTNQPDKSWEWAWDILSDEAQEKVKQVRSKAALFLEENTKVKE